jgi:hypothetical protein
MGDGVVKGASPDTYTLKTGSFGIQTKKPRNCLLRSARFDLLSSTSIPPRETGTLGKGGLAQLVERLLCKQNVNGSNPLTSTIFHEAPRTPAREETLCGIQMGL